MVEKSDLIREIERLYAAAESSTRQLQRVRQATCELYDAMKAGDHIVIDDVGCNQAQPWSHTQQRFVGIAVDRAKIDPKEVSDG